MAIPVIRILIGLGAYFLISRALTEAFKDYPLIDTIVHMTLVFVILSIVFLELRRPKWYRKLKVRLDAIKTHIFGGKST